MKIYTKTGDKGNTSLYGGKRISKAHLRIESYGTIDELNSYIGLLRDLLEEKSTKEFLLNIQNKLFTIGSNLASNPEKEKNKSIPDITSKDIETLEKEIDSYNENLDALQFFILPGGHPSISHSHIARCICRRSERLCVALAEIEKVDNNIIVFLNRLSDYLFTLSRKIGKDLGIKELEWKVN